MVIMESSLPDSCKWLQWGKISGDASGEREQDDEECIKPVHMLVPVAPCKWLVRDVYSIFLV